MAENDSSPATSLQFDKAEYSGPQTGASVCGVCKQPIAQTYYTVNAAIVCDQCHGKVAAFATRGSKFGRAFAATALGLAAGLAGAALWYVVRRTTGYEIGLIAILVGVMVGVAVRKGSKGRGGRFYQTLAIVLTYGCICAQYMPDFVQAFVKQFREAQAAPARGGETSGGQIRRQKSGRKCTAGKGGAPGCRRTQARDRQVYAGPCRLIGRGFRLVAGSAVLGWAQNIIGLLIIGIALYEAWKINQQSPVRIAGPFQLAPVPLPRPA